jgi:hypothetical protein
LGGVDSIISLITEQKSSKVPNPLIGCALSCLSSLVDSNRKFVDGAVVVVVIVIVSAVIVYSTKLKTKLAINVLTHISSSRALAEIQTYASQKNVMKFLGELIKTDTNMLSNTSKALFELLKNNGISLFLLHSRILYSLLLCWCYGCVF